MDKTIPGVKDAVEVKTDEKAPLENKDQTVTIKADETATQTAVVEEKTEVDYEAELARLEKERDEAINGKKKAEDKIVQLKRDGKNKVETEGFEEDAPDESDVNEIVEKKISEEREKLRRELAQDSLEAEFEKISDPKERQLVQFHYENTIRTTGISRQAIRNDVERARILANAAKVKKTISEVAESAKAKATTRSVSAGNNQDIEPVENTNLSQADIALLARYGLKPTDVKQ